MTQLLLREYTTRHALYRDLGARDRSLAGLAFQAECVRAAEATLRLRGSGLHGFGIQGPGMITEIAWVVDSVTGRLIAPWKGSRGR